MSVQERVQDVAISGDWVYFHVDQGSTWPLYRINRWHSERELNWDESCASGSKSDPTLTNPGRGLFVGRI